MLYNWYMNKKKRKSYRSLNVYARLLMHALWRCSRVLVWVQERNIASDCTSTSKVSISTFKCIAFPSGILRSWRIEKSSFRFIWIIWAGQFHELFSSSISGDTTSCICRCEVGYILVSNATRMYDFICEYSFNDPDRDEELGVRICLLRKRPTFVY